MHIVSRWLKTYVALLNWIVLCRTLQFKINKNSYEKI